MCNDHNKNGCLSELSQKALQIGTFSIRNQQVVIILTLDVPSFIWWQKILTPHHFDIYLGLGDESQYCVRWQSFTPRIIILIVGLPVRVLVQSQVFLLVHSFMLLTNSTRLSRVYHVSWKHVLTDLSMFFMTSWLESKTHNS